MKNHWLWGIGLALAGYAAPASANETVTYAYDALGRLVAVAHSGTVNDAVQSTYAFDKAGNRTSVTVTNAQNISRVAVVPLNGLTVIPIPAP